MHFANEESYASQGIHIHCNSDVVALNPSNKTVTVRTDEGEHEQSYDKLLLSPGGAAVKPPFPGIDLDGITTFRGPEDTQYVKEAMETAQKAVVVGGGYIGLEVAEAFGLKGIDTTVVDLEDRILKTYLDEEFTDILTKEAESHGVKFSGGEKVEEFRGEDGHVRTVVTDQGEYEADVVVLAMGVKPDDRWLNDVLEMDERGFIKVDEYLRTSVEDVYAGGDSTMIPYGPTGKDFPIALATMARRQGVVAAMNALGHEMKMPELNGTSALRYFGYNFVTTGLSSSNLDDYNGKVASKFVVEKLYPDFMRKEDNEIYMKVFYDEDTHRILGGQLMSKHDISDGIVALSFAISSKWTLEQMSLADIFFQPNFDRPWHYLNVLALAALDWPYTGADQLLF